MNGQYEDTALRMGFRLLDRARRHFPLYPGVTAAATRRWARARETELVGYARALWVGAAWAADPANEVEAIEFIAQDRQLGREAARHLYAREGEHRTRATPAAEEVVAALEVVRRLRREMTGVGRDLTAYFDDRYMRGLRRTGLMTREAASIEGSAGSADGIFL